MIITVMSVTVANAADIFLDWNVSLDLSIKPVSTDQPVEINVNIGVTSSNFTDSECKYEYICVLYNTVFCRL